MADANISEREIAAIKKLQDSGIFILPKGEFSVERICELWDKIAQLENPKSGLSYVKQVMLWRVVGKEMFHHSKYLLDMMYACIDIVEQFTEGTTKRNRKRWSKEEEEMLIDEVCEGMTITQISLELGRTPTSIQTKISNLVGLKRLSMDVAGRFIGTIDGEEVNGNISGQVYKQK